MNLSGLMLDLLRYTQGVEAYAVSAIERVGRRLTLDGMSGRTGGYDGGTVFFPDGSHTEIKSGSAQTLFVERIPAELSAGEWVEVALWQDFDRQETENAIQSALLHYPTAAEDETLVYHDGVEELALPEGVTDVRQIYMRSRHTGHWCQVTRAETERGWLRLHCARGFYEDGGPIRLVHVKPHGKLRPEQETDPSVDLDFLRTEAVINLCRKVMLNQRKDNPIIVDIYNESKANEAEMKRRGLPFAGLPIRFVTNWW